MSIQAREKAETSPPEPQPNDGHWSLSDEQLASMTFWPVRGANRCSRLPNWDEQLQPSKEKPPYDVKLPRPRSPKSNPETCCVLQWLSVLAGQENGLASGKFCWWCQCLNEIYLPPGGQLTKAAAPVAKARMEPLFMVTVLYDVV